MNISKKMIECLFCGETKPRGKEHIIPRWLQIFVGGSTSGAYIGRHIAPFGHKVLSERKHPGQSYVCGHVCVDCNSGWMSGLECSVRPVLEQFIAGDLSAKDWSQESINSLASWIYKTALMINSGTNYRQTIPVEHYREFYSTRKPPTGACIDIALSEGGTDEIESVQGAVLGIIRPEQSTTYQVEHKQNHYALTLRMKRLLTRVVYWPSNAGIIELPSGSPMRIFPSNGLVSFGIYAESPLSSFVAVKVRYDK